MSLFGTSMARRRGSSGGGGLTIVLQKVMLVACQDIITLNAVLTGNPIGAQTYLWEQLTGTPVTWLEDQDQTMVMFQQPTARDDKTFRFYLDKGTPYEQHADILVTLISLDTGPTPRLAYLYAQDGLDNQTIGVGLVSQPAPTDDQLGVVVVNNPERMLSFAPLQNTVNAAYLQLNQLLSGTVSPLQTGTIQTIVFRGLSNNLTYRVDTVYNNNGFVQTFKGVATNIQPVSHPELAYMEAFNAQAKLNGITSTSSTAYRTLVTEVVPVDPLTALGIELRGIVDSGVVTHYLSLESVSVPEDAVTNLGIKLRGITSTETVSQSSYSSIG